MTACCCAGAGRCAGNVSRDRAAAPTRLQRRKETDTSRLLRAPAAEQEGARRWRSQTAGQRCPAHLAASALPLKRHDGSACSLRCNRHLVPSPSGPGSATQRSSSSTIRLAPDRSTLATSPRRSRAGAQHSNMRLYIVVCLLVVASCVLALPVPAEHEVSHVLRLFASGSRHLG